MKRAARKAVDLLDADPIRAPVPQSETQTQESVYRAFVRDSRKVVQPSAVQPEVEDASLCS